MNYDLWAPKRRIDQAYRQAINNLLRSIFDLIPLGVDPDPASIAQQIRLLVAGKAFQSYAYAAAGKMVTSLFSDSGNTWRKAALHNSKGKVIYNSLQKELEGPVGARVQYLINRNANMISSLPLDVANAVAQHVRAEALKGKRHEQIAEELPSFFPRETTAKAGLIARTECSKVHTALIQARAENLGVNWYVWRTSKDARVRSSHDHMEKVLVSWRDPPSPERLIGEKSVGQYHAGEIWNCRCFPQPLYDVALIKWPCNVYYGGNIVSMSRLEFEKKAK